ncbi:MAG: DUF3352 domain-containing protein [Acidobacteriota bacterium]
MNATKIFKTCGWVLLCLALTQSTLLAQRRRPSAPKIPAPGQAAAAPTFDTLLAADSYKVYGEVRGIGQLIRSSGVNDVLEPVMKVAGPPKEFRTLVKWLNSQADTLMTSRMMFAAWPSRPKLPQVLFAIEFDSAEEAQKFEPRLKEFLPRFFPTPDSSPAPADGKHPPKSPNAEPGPKETAQPKPEYILKQSGSLVYITDVPFTFKSLRPAGSKLLAEDQNFRRVHDRFTSESIFIYVDTNSMERENQERRQKYEEEERKRIEAEAANPPKPDESNDPSAEMTADLPPEEIQAQVAATPEAIAEVQTQRRTRVMVGGPPAKDSGPEFMSLLSMAFFGGRTVLPEAVGVAISFEPESYSVRALLVNNLEAKGTVLPFAPQLVSGPALAPEASSILPADTELFVTLSLDYPLIYEGMVKALNRVNESMPASMRQANKETNPFASYEKTLGIKIKDDVLPLLGNEIAFSVPMKTLDVGPQKPPPDPSPASSPATGPEESAGQKSAEPATPSPVIAISIRDKEGVRALLPKIIESLGVKGANMLAQTEKRDDTELVSYAGAISYAFIGNFLLMSPDTKALRHVVDSYLSHETLAADTHFRNSTRWQPRQVLGQIYVSPALMESYSSFARGMDSPITNQLSDLLARLSPTAEPVTYALSNEGLGPLHELHVPRNLVLLMIAGISGATEPSSQGANESVAKSALRTIVSAEATYQATTGDGNYGTLEGMVKEGLLSKDMIEKYGYRIELTCSGTSFEARATPLEYGKTGKMSFFIDETGLIRGGDHGGGPATVSDKPLQ